MAQTYRIFPGELIVLRENRAFKYWRRALLNVAIRVLWIVFSLVGTGLTTCIIYWKASTAALGYTDVYTLLDSITTGALFATFGSALISVFTLFSGQYLNLFSENLTILHEDLALEDLQGTQWKRWPFLPRMGRLPLSGQTRYSALNNASISFQLMDENVVFPLPTTLADFRELPVLCSYFKMKRYKRKYLKYLEAAEAIGEYPAWDCVCTMYKDILLYRFSYACVWIGMCFVFHSILFSFLYPSLYPYMAVFFSWSSVFFA